MTDSDSDLQGLVRRYHVTWETRPEMGSNGRSVSPIGYVIELSAVSDHPEHDASLACPECTGVEDALGRLTAAIAPSESVHVGRGARQFGRAHDGRPEAAATVTVLHQDGGGANRPPDQAEQQRVDALVGRLRALGAQEGHWHEGSTAQPSANT